MPRKKKQLAPPKGAAPITVPDVKEGAYPDLLPVIKQLHGEYANSSGERQKLLEKWLNTLIKTEREMRQLEKLEDLSTAYKGAGLLKQTQTLRQS